MVVPWLAVGKLVLANLDTIVGVAKPLFTRKKPDSQPAPADLAGQQIAAPLKQVVTALDEAALAAAREREKGRSLAIAAIAISVVSLVAVILALWAPHAGAQADPAVVPKHLAIARELVEHTLPENNQYKLGSQFISFPGDPAGRYQVRADCSGFLLAIFARAQYPTRSMMAFLPGTARKQRRPASEDFVHSIEMEKGFKRIRDLRDIRPGDLLAHAMLDPADQKRTGTTGHVFLLDSLPRAIPPRNPVVAGTTQFEVVIIDSNEEHVGSDDTRLADPANKLKGLGRGTIRLYADASGQLVGWARTFRNASRFFSYDPRFPSDTKLRKAAIGRPVSGS